MRKHIFLTVAMALMCVLGMRAQTTTIATTLPYGETLEFTVELAGSADSVYVDWGDGVRRGYHDGQRSWHTNTWVHGKLLNDTITMYGSIKRIDIDGDSLTVLKFANQPQLTAIYARHNKLTNDGLDISGCVNLETLDIGYNNMMYLNLLNHGSLQYFYVNNNPEFNTAVFAANNANLKQIDMDDCDIVHFYPTKLPSLSSLSIANGSLADIDLSDNYPKLHTLNLGGNKYLESVDVTQMPELESLQLNDTRISEVNISQNPALTSLTLSHTNVSRLNVSNNTNLVSIGITGCPISKLDVRGLLNLHYVYADSTQISRLDLSDKRFVRGLSLRGTNIEFLDMHRGIGYNTLKSLDIRDCKNMTPQTLNFTFDAMPPHDGQSYRTNVFIAGSNGEHANTDLLVYDASNAYKVDVEGDGTASMDSIQIVPQTAEGGTYTLLQEGTSSDVDSEGNYFPFRPVNSRNVVMPGYPLKVVAVPDSGYVFAGVEVNGKFFDDSLCVASVAGTTIKPVFRSSSSGDKIVLTVPGGAQQQYFLAAAEDNTPITVDWGDGTPVSYTLSSTRATTVACEGGTQGTTVTISGPVTYADFSSYPGFATDNQISAIDLSGNEHLQYLTTYMNEIGSIDVSKEKDLIYLDCSYNELDTLDISANTQLMALVAYGNYLTGIDLSHQPNLVQVNLKVNMLDNIDLSNNPSLVELQLQNNDLKTINVSNMPQLKTLNVFGNQLETIDVSHNPLLTDLSVNDNKLKTLNLSANTELTTLNASGNELEMLDLSNNTKLNYINVARNGWDACTTNDFYYLLPNYPEGVELGDYEDKMRLRVYGNTTSSNPGNDAAHAESVIATGKGWAIDQKGDGTGCDDAYVTLLPVSNGSATMATEDGTPVASGSKVKKNTVVVVTATPANGYVLQSVEANGENAAGGKFTVKACTEVLVQFTVNTSIDGISNGQTTVQAGKGEILFQTSAPVKADVFTVGGQQVFSGTVSGQQAVGLKSGVYVVRIGDVSRKMLVE